MGRMEKIYKDKIDELEKFRLKISRFQTIK